MVSTDDNPRSRRWMLGALLAISAAGAFFRLYDLNAAALRSDSIEFHRICGQPVSPAYIFGHWDELLGLSGQLPLAMAWTKGFMDVFHLPLAEWSLRLPSAIWGILTIPAFFLVGRRVGGVRLGLLVAALLALNPFHIQVSREAYYYPPMILGAALVLDSVFAVLDAIREGARVHWPVLVLHAVGFFLMTYSQPSGWPIAGVCGAIIAVTLIREMARRRRLRGDAVILGATYLVLGVPLLVVPWGYQQLAQFTGSVRDYWAKVFGSADQSVWPMVGQTLTSYAWGGTPLRLALVLACLALAVVWLIRTTRVAARHWILPALVVAGFVLFNASRHRTGFGCEPRYVLALMPAYLVLVGAGLAQGLDGFGRLRRPVGPWLQAVAGLAVLAPLVAPAWLCTQVTGQPTPYKDIIRWVDRNLPRGTLVLVDRWFEPWNELRVYDSTNVVFTITVPDEPPDGYIKNRWHDTAVEFFATYPEAAYLEFNRSERAYRGIVGTVPFARSVAFTNAAGLRLRHLGVANRGDYYAPDNNRLIMELFYNTRDDVVARARRGGKAALVLHGDGWTYRKPWREMQGDFRAWQEMQDAAALEVYNLGDAPTNIVVRLTGVAPAGMKRVQAGTGEAGQFDNQRLQTWSFTVPAVPPGALTVRLTDPQWERQRRPLWVGRLE